VTVAAGLVVAGLLAARSAGGSDDEPDVALPGVWVSQPHPESSVKLDPSGTGYFTDFPLWAGGSCDAERMVRYSGELRWTAADGYFRVEGPNGPILFRPADHVGRDDWTRLVISLCGESTAADELVVYQGGPGRGPTPGHQPS